MPSAQISRLRPAQPRRKPAAVLPMYTPPATDAKGHVATVSASTGTPAATKPQQGVFVVRNQGGKLKAVFVPVTTGITGATDIEVTSGLRPGDEIVTGTYRVLRGLKDGTPVKRDTTPAVAKDSDSSSSS